MSVTLIAANVSLLFGSLGAAPASIDGDAGPLVQALWLVHDKGSPQAIDPRNDLHTKGALSKALGKNNVLHPSEMEGLIDRSTFARLAGADLRLEPAEVRRIVEAGVPTTRDRLLQQVRAHADYLTTTFDLIDETHLAPGEKLVEWLVRNYQPGRPLHVTFICTGNSRRSMLGATTGNIAAAYYGLPEIRFHSGGTAPTAFNVRTIAALREIGVEIEPTGDEAPRGDPEIANPTYQVRWGNPAGPDEPRLEATEFSKLYSAPINPQSGFVALLVCGEADAACPVVKGAALRISMPYLDPKIYDGGSFETTKYAERRDDMARLMLSVMMRVRRHIEKS